ncbi:MAG: C10 family peptidase [Bacteroidales bacterium]|nr:C10 family peptidase [Bacteroidales bacterium]MBR5703024.1 C10 family peptidase [Bacteroidales bacterium]
MKRFLLLIYAALLLASPVLKADDISLNKARKAAEMFFAQCGVTTRAGSSLTLLGTDLTLEPTRSGQAPAWYVFNRAEGGFVIISGLDAAMPVLGYSFEDEFCPLDEMPENLQAWMDAYTEDINSRRASGKKATAEELARWNDALTMTRTTEIPAAIDLQTPNFNQNTPYNWKTPLTASGRKVVTGCTPTAVCIVMAYYKHPAHGTGTLTAYTKNGITVPEMLLDTIPFQWDKIRSSYKSGSYTTEEGYAVATLMAVVGSMMRAAYSSNGTGAAMSASKLTKYMDYDSCVVRYARSYSTADSWKSMLKSYLAAGHPFLIVGWNSSGSMGHSYVIDGYDAHDRFLINYGWGGQSNGYYQMDAFGTYRYSQVVYHVRPNEGGSPTPNLRLTYGDLDGSYFNGIRHTGGMVATNNTFNITFGIVHNYGYYPFSGLLNFAHTDKDGNIKCMLRSDIAIPSLASGDDIAWDVSQKLMTTEPIEQGDKVVPLYRKNTSDPWRKFDYRNKAELCPEMALHIRDYTTVDYDVAKAVFKFKTYGGTIWQLINSSDEVVDSGTVPKVGTFTIKRKNYPAGTYKLVLDHYSIQSITLTLVF